MCRYIALRSGISRALLSGTNWGFTVVESCMRGIVLVGLAALVLGGACSGSSAAERAVCGAANTTVVVTPDPEVRVTAQPGGCRFTGRTAVALTTVRRTGDGPPPTKVDLGDGDTFVQPYKVVVTPPCPLPGPGSPSKVGVQLETDVVEVEVGHDTAEFIGCVTLQAGQPTVERHPS
jgi:hypothetical protein